MGVRNRKGKDKSEKSSHVVRTKRNQGRQDIPANATDGQHELPLEHQEPSNVAAVKQRGKLALIVGVILTLLALVAWVCHRWIRKASSSGNRTMPMKVTEADPSPALEPSATKEASSTKTTTRTSMGSSPWSRTQFGTYELLETLPHDPQAFTQGLVLLDNQIMLEGTGGYGGSELRSVNLSTGIVLKRHGLKQKYFGEGIAYFTTDPRSESTQKSSRQESPGWIVQITWKEKVGLIYDSDTFTVHKRFIYNTTTTEGWGITFDPDRRQFWVSDGSSYLHVWGLMNTSSTPNVDSEHDDVFHNWGSIFEEVAKISVRWQASGMDQPKAVSHLNELEWDPSTSTILANVWYQDILVRIDTQTGFVTTVYDLQSLYPPNQRSPSADVLNGVALVADFKAHPDQVWVTGKLWPHLYRIRLVEPSPRSDGRGSQKA